MHIYIYFIAIIVTKQYKQKSMHSIKNMKIVTESCEWTSRPLSQQPPVLVIFRSAGLFSCSICWQFFSNIPNFRFV